MIHKELDKIKLSDLAQLIDNGVSESKTIEYKRELPGDSDQNKKEFLADISSFANTSGGDLIYGIEEEKGSPKSIDGVQISNVDEAIRKYENMIRDGIKPRISVETKAVSVPNKSNFYVLIFRIKKSWQSSHGVTYQDKGHGKFYARNSVGKYQLDVQELRNAFNMSETLIERIRNFKTERISQISSDNLPRLLHKGGKILLHLIPLESFSPNYSVNLGKAKSVIQDAFNNFFKEAVSSTAPQYNFEGILCGNHAGGYIQFYHNGIIEFVDAQTLNKREGLIPSKIYEEQLLKGLKNLLKLLKDDLGVNMPIAVFLTLIGVKNCEMRWDDLSISYDDTERSKIDRDILQLPETIIESYETQAEAILRPMFDMIWNACGFERSLNFDPNGNWIK